MAAPRLAGRRGGSHRRRAPARAPGHRQQAHRRLAALHAADDRHGPHPPRRLITPKSAQRVPQFAHGPGHAGANQSQGQAAERLPALGLQESAATPGDQLPYPPDVTGWGPVGPEATVAWTYQVAGTTCWCVIAAWERVGIGGRSRQSLSLAVGQLCSTTGRFVTAKSSSAFLTVDAPEGCRPFRSLRSFNSRDDGLSWSVGLVASGLCRGRTGRGSPDQRGHAEEQRRQVQQSRHDVAGQGELAEHQHTEWRPWLRNSTGSRPSRRSISADRYQERAPRRRGDERTGRSCDRSAEPVGDDRIALVPDAEEDRRCDAHGPDSDSRAPAG